MPSRFPFLAPTPTPIPVFSPSRSRALSSSSSPVRRGAVAVGCALLACFSAQPAMAGLTFSTSVSDSVSASVGSVSGSIRRSSESSKRDDDKVAAGDYQVLAVADVPEQPGMMRVELQAVAQADDRFFLYLPGKALQGTDVAAGGVVTARPRPYGVEFAAGPAHTAFFLVMEDAWLRELGTREVAL